MLATGKIRQTVSVDPERVKQQYRDLLPVGVMVTRMTLTHELVVQIHYGQLIGVSHNGIAAVSKTVT